MPLRADAIANRERILVAARAVFAESGIDAEVKEIADRAGLGVGTIYRNFPTKHGLLIELVRVMMGEIAAGFSEAEDQAHPIDGLRVALRNVYSASMRNGWLMEAKISGRLPLEVRACFPPAAKDARNQALLRLVMRGQQDGYIRADADPDVIISLLFGSTTPIMHGLIGDRRPVEDIATTVLDHVLQGVATTKLYPRVIESPETPDVIASIT